MTADDGRGSNGVGFLIGPRVYLRPLGREDLTLVQKWANDPEIRRLTGQVPPMSQAAAEEFYDKVRSDPDRVWFIIVLRETNQPVGEAGLLRMFYPWRTTDLSLIIGEKDAWGQGYGREAILLLLDHAFGALNFHRVSLGVVGFNRRALGFYESIGFKQEGIQREGYFSDHEYHDFVMMSILEDEYRALHKERD